MKTIYTLIGILGILTMVSLNRLQGQQTISYNSTVNVPQLRLVEETDDKTAKIFFQNLNLPNEKWSLAGKLGTDPTFGLFYNGSKRVFYDEKQRLLENRDDFQMTSSSNNEDLSLTFGLIGGLGGTGYGSIYFEDEVDGMYGQIRALSDQSNSVVPKHLALSGGMENGNGNNFLTLYNKYSLLGPTIFETVDPARLVISHSSADTVPHLTLYQKTVGGFARLHFKNRDETNVFSIDATPDRNQPSMQIGYNNEGVVKIFTFDDSGVIAGQVGINKDPVYALDLPNVAANNTGRGRARSWDTYSDQRVKRETKPITYGIEELMQLKPVSYHHHSSSFDSGILTVKDDYKKEIGFLAQEIYEVLPEVVYKPEDDTKDLWSVSYSNIIPVLTKAIQEQQNIICEMKNEIRDLKDQLSQVINSSNLK